MKKEQIVLLCLALVVSLVSGQSCPSSASIPSFADGKTPTNTVTVGASGADFTTIEAAFDSGEVTPGTYVELQGTVTGGQFLSDINGTADSPIWIGGTVSAPATISGGGSSALQCVRCAYVVFQYITVDGYSGNGINCDDGDDRTTYYAAHHLVFRHLTITNIGSGNGNSDCLKLSGVNYHAIYNNTFGPCSGQTVDHVGCHFGIVAFNRVTTGNIGIQTKGGSSDMIIAWNRFQGVVLRAINAGGSTDFEYFRPPLSTTEANAEAERIYVFANVFNGNGADIAFPGCVNCVAAHNTHINPTAQVFRLLQETTTSGSFTFTEAGEITFVNELVYYSDDDLTSQRVNIGSNTRPESCRWINNLWYDTSDTSGGAPATSEYMGGTVTGTIFGDNPDLTNEFQIGSSSPAAGAGATEASQTPNLQLPPIDYSRRCYRVSEPSIGAFEASPDTSCGCSSIYDFFGQSEGDGSDGADGDGADGDGGTAACLLPWWL